MSVTTVGEGTLQAIGSGTLMVASGGSWEPAIPQEPEGPSLPDPGTIGLYANMTPSSMTSLTYQTAFGLKATPTRNAQINQLGTAVELTLGMAADLAMRAAILSTSHTILADSGWVTVTKGSPATKDWYDVFLTAPYSLSASTPVIFAFSFRKASDSSGYAGIGLLSNGSYVSSWVGTLFGDASNPATYYYNAGFGAADGQSDYRGSFRTTEMV